LKNSRRSKSFKLQAALDEHKKRAADPEPLKAEARKIEKEIENLVEACASGAQSDIKRAIDKRRARLEHLSIADNPSGNKLLCVAHRERRSISETDFTQWKFA
jgi:hypothetical protein